MLKNERADRFVQANFNFMREFISEEQGRCDILVKGSAITNPTLKLAVVNNCILLNIGFNAVKNYGHDQTHFWFDGRIDGTVFSETISYRDVIGFSMDINATGNVMMVKHGLLTSVTRTGEYTADLMILDLLATENSSQLGMELPDPTAPEKPPTLKPTWTPRVIQGSKPDDKETAQ